MKIRKKNVASCLAAASDNERVAQAAGVVGAATFLTRVMGYVRDMVIASFFGAGLVSDAFIAAFRVPNLLRRLFGEGSLGAAFIPVFTDTLTQKGHEEAEQFALGSFRFLLLTLVAASLIGVVAAPALVHLLAYGFIDDPEKYALCVKLTRIMFPYSIFIGLVALCMGILNVLGHFAAPALAPLMLNFSMIGMVVLSSWVSPSMTTRVVGLAAGVIIGGVFQFAIQVPFLVKKGIRLWRSAPFWHPAMKKVIRLLGPVLFGAAVYQINNLVTCLFASFLPQGSVSYLYYADRLIQFPLGVFAIAIATAVLPTLSHQASMGQIDALKNTFVYAMQFILFLTLPSMVGLILLREPIVAVLFQRGAFDGQTTQLTASALLYYGIGLWAFSIVRILVYAFYALKDACTPAVAGVISIAANAVLGAVLMQYMGHNGLALALSLASMLHLGVLVVELRKKVIGILWGDILRSVIRSAGCSLLMGGAVSAVNVWMARQYHASNTLLGLIVCIITGVAAFSASAFLFKAPEIQSVKKLIMKWTMTS